jgi:SAM-dependent methyltransferase
MAQSGYNQIAAEYYDTRHITSRNFDNTTRAALRNYPLKAPNGLTLEIGAGRGRANEFLNVNTSQLVQLDSSAEMLNLQPREDCLLKVHADACSIPLVSQQFSAVVGFLIDPFIGLNSLAEAHRMLMPNGVFLVTVPADVWGIQLRKQLDIDPMTTRFKIIGTEKQVVLPSLLYSKTELRDMLGVVDFRDITINDCFLPGDEETVSQDITSVCDALNIDVHKLPLLYVIRAVR